MDDPAVSSLVPARAARAGSAQARHKSLLERLTSFIFREPENREDLLDLLTEAHARNLLDAEALSMIEGVLQVSELRAGEVMVPSSQMDVIDIAEPPSAWIPHVVRTGHSRFPVIDGNRDQVVGVLLAKDMLRLYTEKDFDVRSMLRPAVFVPDSKPLNDLLRDFRVNQNHMAIIVDEYGGVAGLITIEDVLEQIVGDIDDEYDFDEQQDHIIADAHGHYRVKALTEIAQFNTVFATAFADDEFNTIGGLITNELGRVPRRGDVLELGNLRFEVIRADARRAHWLKVERVPKTLVQEFAQDDTAAA